MNIRVQTVIYMLVVKQVDDSICLFDLLLLIKFTRHIFMNTIKLCLSTCSFVLPVPLPPSRRRSLFVLSTSMIIFSSKAFNILPLVPRVKAVLTDKVVG